MPNSNKKPIMMKYPDTSSPMPEYLEAVAQFRKNEANGIESLYPLFKVADMFHIKEIDISDIAVDLSELDIITTAEMLKSDGGVLLLRNGNKTVYHEI